MTTEIDEAVDVPSLLEYPAEALHPVLKHLKGWEEVTMLKMYQSESFVLAWVAWILIL